MIAVDLIQGAAILIWSIHSFLTMRSLHRTQKQVRRLTQRVWILEGRPRWSEAVEKELEA